MKPPNTPKVLFLTSLLCALPATSHAVYPVFDAVANRTLSVIQATELSQKAELINQLNTLRAQLDTIRRIEQIIGNPGSATPRDIESILQSVPGFGDTSSAGLFSSTGFLNLFGNMSVNEYKTAVTDPAKFVANDLMSRSMGISATALSELGMKQSEINMARQITSMNGTIGSPGNLETGIKLGNLLTARVLNAQEENAKRNQQLAAIVADDQKAGQNAAKSDLTSQVKVMNEQQGTQNQIALETLRQQGEASTANAANTHIQTQILADEQLRSRLDRLNK